MKANFIKRLCESSINTTEVALAVSNIGDELQSMVEKLTNIKIKDVAELSKKIKFSGDVNGGESFEQNIGAKLDSAIAALTEIKGDIDNQVVEISQGGSLEGGDNASQTKPEDSDMAADLGDEEDFDEFNPDEEENSEDDGLDGLEDLEAPEITREKK